MLQRTKWLLVVVAWIGFVGISFVLLEHSDYGGGDFKLYYSAARDYLPERMPYASVIGIQSKALNYPPLLPQLLMPLAKSFNMQTAMRLWFGISAAALIALLAALACYLPPKRRFIFWLLAAFFVPSFEALRIGQVNVIMLALIGFAWVSVKEDHPTLAGVLLVAASWIKIYPALILVYFLWKRNWRAAWGGFLGGVGFGLFQIVVSGPGLLVEFFRSLLLVSGPGEAHLMWKNNSIFGFASKLFLDTDRVVPLLVNSTLFTVTRIGLTLLVIAALFYLSGRSPKQRTSLKDNGQFDLEYALVVLTMLLISPWLYADSIAPVFLVGFILWRQGYALVNRLLLIVAGVLIEANYLVTWQAEYTISALVLSVGFYALAILWVMTVRELWRAFQRAPAIATSRQP